MQPHILIQCLFWLQVQGKRWVLVYVRALSLHMLHAFPSRPSLLGESLDTIEIRMRICLHVSPCLILCIHLMRFPTYEWSSSSSLETCQLCVQDFCERGVN